MTYKMVDVSSIQGNPDWERAAEDGIQGAILRIRDSKGVDRSWEYNYRTCGEVGIPRGAYRYSYALTVAQARAEAREVLRTLDGRKLELGVWLDLEWSRQRELGSRKVKQLARVWMQEIRSAGYPCNVYCNLEWYQKLLQGLDAKYWIARYPKRDTGVLINSLRPRVGEKIWQYSSKGKVAGIFGKVDLDEWTGGLQIGASRGEAGNPYKDSGKVLFFQPLLAGIAREDVRWLQWELREAGYQLQVDGRFGPKTDLALRAFQAAHGLKADGKCGPATRAALRGNVG